MRLKSLSLERSVNDWFADRHTRSGSCAGSDGTGMGSGGSSIGFGSSGSGSGRGGTGGGAGGSDNMPGPPPRRSCVSQYFKTWTVDIATSLPAPCRRRKSPPAIVLRQLEYLNSGILARDSLVAPGITTL
jgi:hypothetical protein